MLVKTTSNECMYVCIDVVVVGGGVVVGAASLNLKTNPRNRANKSTRLHFRWAVVGVGAVIYCDIGVIRQAWNSNRRHW
jgi:hypothetical protein